MKKMNKKGFTIVELVIVIAVIGILATVLIPTFGTVITNAQNESFRLAARNTFVEYTAVNPEEISGDFIYVDGEKFAAINDGKIVLDDKGEVAIYTSYTAAAAAAGCADVADDPATSEVNEAVTYTTPADDFKGLFKPVKQ